MPDTWITRREAAELSGTSETTVKKAIDLGIVPARPAGGQSRIDSADVPVLTMLGHLNGVGLGATHKRRLRRWLRAPEAARRTRAGARAGRAPARRRRGGPRARRALRAPARAVDRQ